ncbi:MAG TPA: transglutaminase-like domain-containing protein [Candidatus Nanoarchaeia archaeon]|nr:transglutaminase-like domain-containing protein [Candidatus Nanoarchaeia archaeon]
MGPAKKARSSRKHGLTRRWLVVTSAVVLVAALLAATYAWYPRNSADSTFSQPSASPALTVSPSPTAYGSPAFQAFISHYLGIMQNLNSSATKVAIAPLLNPSYNQTSLFEWEHSRLTFVSDPAGFFEDPIQILSSGKGICVQWSIVYVSACLSLGYQSRLVVAVDTSSWTFIHTWAEDFYHGSWVHVDPSDSVWNNPSRYLAWDWGRYLGSQVKVYAFEDGSFQDVTSTYSAPLT